MADVEPTTAPEPDEYLPPPDYDEAQDDEQQDGGVLLLARTLVTPQAPRSFAEALDWCVKQARDGGPVWHLLCQKFCRSAPGCPGGFASALDQWFGMPDSARHVGGRPEEAPTGSTMFSRSRNPDSAAARFGHVIYTARPFGNGRQGAWGTDSLRVGWPDKINPAELYARWDHEYLGWGENMNGLWLDIKEPPAPQTKDYPALAAARVSFQRGLEHLRTARGTAKELGDWRDRDVIQQLIDLGKRLEVRTEDAHTKLRHK